MRESRGFRAEGRVVLILQNPRAGSQDRQQTTQELAAELQRRGFDVSLFRDVEAFARQAAQAFTRQSLRAVVAAGGDGTATLAVQRAPEGVPLALFPLGTENLLAKYLDYSADPRLVAERIEQGHGVRLDAGLANGRLFLLMAGCGFDAEVVRRVHARRTGNIRHWSYAKPILDAIRSYQYPELRVYCDPPPALATQAVPWRGRWAFVINVPRYAGGLQFVPLATGRDGLLDVCVFRGGSLWNGLRYLLGIRMGWHLGWPDVQTGRVTRVRIESDQAISYQLDGDPGGELPVEVAVLPGRLAVLVAEEWGEPQGSGGAARTRQDRKRDERRE